MEKCNRLRWSGLSLLVLSLSLLIPAASHADPGNNYCVTPAFVSGNIPPNLLLMIDNSASMYDLAFVDKGKKHCSVATTTSCFVDADCGSSGGTCSVFDRQPYYCYDQTYSNPQPTATPPIPAYAGYFANKDRNQNDVYYSYDFTANGFTRMTAAFPGDCGTHSSTITKKDSNNNTVCVEYKNDSTRQLVSFVAKGNYLNWLTSSKFDIEKQIFTGGKQVTKVCGKRPDVVCNADADCTVGAVTDTCGTTPTFLQPESRGCVGQGFIKDALTSNFVNYNSPVTNNTNTQLAVTFSVHGPMDQASPSPSSGGQTYIDLFTSARTYDYGSCQAAVDAISSTSSSNATVKQTVASCLSGSSAGYCSGNIGIACFSTYPDCYVPGHCSGSASTACTKNTDCTSPQTCVFGYFCESTTGALTTTPCTTPGPSSQCPAASYLCDEHNTAPNYTTPTTPYYGCASANAGTTTGCYTPPTYWCDWGAEWMPNTHAVADCSGNNCGYVCDAAASADPVCHISSTQQGKCSLKPQTSCNTDSDCSAHDNGVCQGYKGNGAHACIQHVAAVDHGTCRQITGATNGICGGQQDYGECIFGASDLLTKSKVNFQQAMQACWQYNRFTAGVSGGADIGVDDLKTLANQCSDIYNGSGSNAAYKTCSNDHTKACTTATVATDCTDGATCTDGPAAIAPGYPALICGSGWEGKLFYKNNGSWIKEGSLNDSTTQLSALTITGTLYDGTAVSNATVRTPSSCLDTDTYPACMKKIYQAFCAGNAAPGVTDPTDAPSNTASYDNLPAILSGVGVQSQLGSPIATLRARVIATTCTADTDCSPGKTCSGGICSSSGLIQQFGPQLRIGTMTFNPYGIGNSTESALSGIRMTKVCSNNTSQICAMDADCGTGNHCYPTVPATDPTTTSSYKNFDGGRITYPIGKGVCATMTTTPCSTDANCSVGEACLNGYCGTKGTTPCTTALNNCTGSSQACIRDDAGSHSAAGSLVQTIDNVRAETWTPFAEAFYNALGYFAAVDQGDGTFKGRTSLRLNSINTTSTTFTSLAAAPMDFNEALQPSEYRCQQNYVLLVTDGSSTADRNSNVNSLASLYAAQANTTTGACTVPSNSVDYGGTSNLPALSWIGYHHNLATFNTVSSSPATALYCPDKATPCNSSGVCPTTNDRSCASYHCSITTGTNCGGAPTSCPTGEVCTRNPRDYVTTYVVFNGADNGSAGVCDAFTLLNNTATNGGTSLKQATNPTDLTKSLTSIFENIAAKASSGTAASILSNSEGSGANILQAVFYPKKVFLSQTSSNWIGEMQNLWYYVDPMINHSTIREDTNGDRKLDLIQDHVVTLSFDNTDNTTYAYMQTDTNGDGLGDTPNPPTKQDPDLVNSVWRAGRQLWQRNLLTSPRTIYTPLLPTGNEHFYDAAHTVHTGIMKFNFGITDTLTDGMTPTPNNEPALRSYLQMPDSASGVKLMQYVHGFDFPDDTTMRSRTVMSTTIKTDAANAGITYPDADLTAAAYKTNPANKGLGVWKLGDIISSTPRIQSNGRLNSYGLPSPGGYADASYNSFLGSNDYLSRGMVYVGANDGMLHAFKLGLLDVTASGSLKATLSGTGLGEERWAFIPKQALPYLNYYADPAYNHIYYVDGTNLVVDASIGDTNTGTCVKATYDQCVKNPVVVVDPNTNNTLDPTKNTWRTVLVGGMGLGGASAKTCTAGTNCVPTPITDPANASNGLGYSSYYALDVTNPEQPTLLWEFSDPGLGFATSGPAIVRVGDRDHNGKWFAVFGSGPTGKIDTSTHQFMGRSDQPLKFFAVDLRTGEATTLMDPNIANAFAGSMVGGAIDADRWNPNVTGNYQDDAIYVGYTAKGTSDWTSGGVLRIVTQEDPNPAHWLISKVVDAGGPVTAAISRLQDRKNRVLWLYFGTGRYYSRSGASIDDYYGQRAIFGIKEPCYNWSSNPGNFLDKSCQDLVTTGITNQSTSIGTVGAGGWKVNLDPYTTSYGAERVVTDAVALTNGTVFITSFEPTADVCGFGGNSYLWALGYNTGGRPPDAALSGKALIQLSTGEFREVDLSQAFGSDSARLMRRTAIPMTGKPPADAFPVVSKSANKPVKKIMHIQER